MPAQSPVVGGWSDATGRKPFLLAALAVGFAPALVLVLDIQFGVSLFWCAATGAGVLQILGYATTSVLVSGNQSRMTLFR